MPTRLSTLTLRGFKSIKELAGFELGALNVLIGANGAGKSNLVAFFRMLGWMTSSPPALQQHVGVLGGASRLLHDSAQTTREISAALNFSTDKGQNEYEFRLYFAAGDTLVFADEKFRFSTSAYPSAAPWTSLGAGHREPLLGERGLEGHATARVTFGILSRSKVYQFHNTSFTSRMRGKWSVEDGQYLKEDGGNLAAVLLRLREGEPAYYQRIVETLRLIAPFFGDFALTPEHGYVLLRWTERGTDVVFDASQASDGLLRAMALCTLLLQPEKSLPVLLVLDEPELGLHPYAIQAIAGLLRSASLHTQIVVATQSMNFVDQFEPAEIVVVNRRGRCSEFERLNAANLDDWLKEYSLSELWEKNVLGGRPAR